MRLSEYSDGQLLDEMARRSGSAAPSGPAFEPEPKPVPSSRGWHPSPATLARLACLDPARMSEAEAEECKLVGGQHLPGCPECSAEVKRLQSLGPANSIVRSREHWVRTGDGPEAAEFHGTAELLAIPWVAEYARKPGFARYSLDGRYLLAERDGGQGWWVVGRLSSSAGVELPRRGEGEGD